MTQEGGLWVADPCEQVGLPLGAHQGVVCSKPSLKFVKKILRFSVFRPGYWEEKSTKAHEQRPEKCSMATSGWQPKATNRRLIATNQRLISTNRPESATNSD